ncbi:M23 family metallopeptidase [Belliella kenyensis]|uniref:M23 family metallopeptidase n=1 Tax=Belliella kenyensis TaxID=1472724 RepID=A0ABV8EPK6_9BACT|nr:M23 family metallopeptidase [Belliella kenyensis]MCH7402546.1 M23 family metallopeptidase [Belliella kenyensis]MDN3603344.1 M23 family metallopeptidase [Belliella kenyensis]
MGLREQSRSWLKTKFLFVIRKEEDFSVITSLSITKLKLGLILILFFFISIGFSLIASRTFLKAWFDPEYLETENTARILELADIVDSLVVEVQQRDLYVKNIQRVISGDTEQAADIDESTTNSQRNTTKEIDLFEKSEATKSIESEFRGIAMDYNNSKSLVSTSFSDAYFFPPLRGVVVSAYNPQMGHFGIDIVASENEPVKAIAAGTVLIASWTLETGYVIGVQHANELVSFYKHNSVLLKSVGDVIKGGEIISIIGNTGELTTGQHLHFELWYKGNSLNPQEFITFN